MSVVYIRAGDEARCLGVLWTPRKDASPSRPAMPNSPLDCWIKLFEPSWRKEKRPHFRVVFLFYGAGDEARTRYLHLGKVALYRMSYTRIAAEHGLL